MRSFVFFLLTAILFSCTNVDEQSQLSKLKKQNDSLKKTISLADSIYNNPQIDSPKIAEDKKSLSVRPKSKAGRHAITLQWIGWDHPGYVDVKPLGDGWYSIAGRQVNQQGQLYMEGKIKRIDPETLEFDGTIKTIVKSIYEGKPCIKDGIQKFYAKDKRKYYRLQNMVNCEGGMLVDYVDIYFGSSGL